MGIPLVTIKKWMLDANLSRGKEHYSEAEIQRCIALYKQGKRPNEIQAMTGILAGTLRSWFRKAGLSKSSQSSTTGSLNEQNENTETVGLQKKRKPLGYWNNFENIQRDILIINEQRHQIGVMPTADELKQLGRYDLERAISRHHGGFQSVAERLGLAYKKKRAGYWHDFTNLNEALSSFINKRGTPGIMPTKEELEDAGEKSLAWAIINLYGGFPELAEKLGLELSYSRKERNYWKDFDNLKREVLRVAEQLGNPDIMPTHEELTQAGRRDLISAISSNGGWTSVARRVGLTYSKK